MTLFIQVVFAFFFQGDVLHESSDEVSKIGALMISTWGVVALAKEMFAEEEKAVDMVSGIVSFESLQVSFCRHPIL